MPSSSEEIDVARGDEESEIVEPSPSVRPAYRELLDVLARARLTFSRVRNRRK